MEGAHSVISAGVSRCMKVTIFARVALMRDLQTMLAELPTTETVPLSVVGSITGLNVNQRSRAVRAGAIQPIRREGRSYALTCDEARLIVVAAALSSAAGSALTTMLRALRGSGLDLAALAPKPT